MIDSICIHAPRFRKFLFQLQVAKTKNNSQGNFYCVFFYHYYIILMLDFMFIFIQFVLFLQSFCSLCHSEDFNPQMCLIILDLWFFGGIEPEVDRNAEMMGGLNPWDYVL